MLGPPKERDLDRPVVASLEALVPAHHFYRHLEAKLDLTFVRDLVRACYAPVGRPSIDPVVFFKLQLILFFEGLRSERQLLEIASLNLAHRWYLGYHLDEPLPDHSSLSRIRRRLGVAVFLRFFEHIVALCQEAGLVWGQELFFDATKVPANADVDSLRPRLELLTREHLEALFADTATDAAEPEPVVIPLDGPPVTAVSPADDPPAAGTLATTAPRETWDLLERYRLDPAAPPRHGYQRTATWRISTTDADATPMSDGGRTALGYHDHYVVDGGKARIILAALVTSTTVMENQPMLDLLWRVRFRRRVWPRRVVGDTTYGTGDIIRAVEDEGIRAYVPLPNHEQRTPYYGPSQFRYDPTRDEYCCPQGQPLRRHAAVSAKAAVRYRAEAATCNACPVKAACTASDQGRLVYRSFHATYLDRVRTYHQTPAYRKAMRKRQVWVEPLFGEAKQWHGLARFRLRGLEQVNTEGLLIAAGQNLKRWLAATGWGRRQAPWGSLVAQPPPSLPLWPRFVALGSRDPPFHGRQQARRAPAAPWTAPGCARATASWARQLASPGMAPTDFFNRLQHCVYHLRIASPGRTKLHGT
ncbi:MAG: transposase [Dehalococcoidia bacterium]|nr:transposase [Dehalococcoidia bacterium]